MSPVGNENVGRLNIAVNNPFRMGSIQGVCDLDRQGEETIEFHGPPIDQMFQRLAGKTLHHDEKVSFMLADFMNRANVGMVQCGSRTRFPPKTFKSLRIARGVVRKEFQRHEASQESIFGLVDNPHSTSTEQFDDPVMGDSLADH